MTLVRLTPYIYIIYTYECNFIYKLKSRNLIYSNAKGEVGGSFADLVVCVMKITYENYILELGCSQENECDRFDGFLGYDTCLHEYAAASVRCVCPV